MMILLTILSIIGFGAILAAGARFVGVLDPVEWAANTMGIIFLTACAGLFIWFVFALIFSIF